MSSPIGRSSEESSHTSIHLLEPQAQQKKGKKQGTSAATLHTSSSSSSGAGDTSTSSEGLSHPIRKNGRYNNPWASWRDPTIGGVLRWMWTTRNESNVPSKRELARTLPVRQLNMDIVRQPNNSGINVTWLGHASCLIQMEGLNILTDPIFSNRCSITQLAGPKRYRPPPCTIHDLPPIHAVLISHNHYDHLDFNTVRLLQARFGSGIRWFVGAGLAAWFDNIGCEDVIEMRWWDENCIPDIGSDVKFVFVPSQHWSKRTLMDTNKSLWGGWCVLGQSNKFYFAGDTGYCPVFEQIGTKYGPFDLAAIPIGAYHPRWMMKSQHVDTVEAVQMHVDLRARHSIGIHWGTFVLTYEHYLEPREKLKEVLSEKGISLEEFFTLDHGETRHIQEVPRQVNDDVHT